MTYHSKHTEQAVEPQFTVQRGAVSRKIWYTAGDDVAWIDGKFARYGTVKEIRAYDPRDGRSRVECALVRCGHGNEVIRVSRLTPAAWGGVHK